jgi:hypothetical protein
MRRVSAPLAVLAVAALAAFASATLAGDAKGPDHSDWDALLKKYVDDHGLVDYKTWKAKDTAALDAYLKKLAAVKDEEKLSKDERLALWINAYNAITIKTILDHYPVKSIKDVSGAWSGNNWTVAGKANLSLDDIEHKTLRKMGEPRIHFAIVCASKGCPFLRKGAFTADKLDAELEEQVQACFADPAKLKIDASSKKVAVIPLFDWFGDDFGASKPQRLTWIAKHVKDPALKKVCIDNDASLSFLDWDWALNER